MSTLAALVSLALVVRWLDVHPAAYLAICPLVAAVASVAGMAVGAA